MLKSEWFIISISSNSIPYSVTAWDDGASMLMMRYRWSIWYPLPGNCILWKPACQIKQRSQRCCKLCIRKLSMNCTIIKLSETVMPEQTFSSGALTFMQYQLLNSAQFYHVLSLFAVLPKLLLVHTQQGWPMTRMEEAAGKAGGLVPHWRIRPNKWWRVQTLQHQWSNPDQTICCHSMCGLQHYVYHCWDFPQFPCQTRCWTLWHSGWAQLATAF